jgi:hypothetical protein
MLFDEELFDLAALEALPLTPQGIWRELMASHGALMATVLLLTVTALLVTLLSPPLP